MPANTAIADISDFWPANRPAYTAIADVADISDFWTTLGGICRHVALLWKTYIVDISCAQFTTVPANTAIAYNSNLWPAKKPANTAIADFVDFADIAVFAGLLAGQKSEMSAIAVFASIVVSWTHEMSTI